MIFKKKNISRLSDEELMVRIKNGDQHSFNELYKRYNERLYYFFLKMLGNDREIANDFLQDIFLKIINKPELFNADYKFSAWIFSMAHNLCKNEYRRRDVRKIVQQNENPDQFVDEQTANDSARKEDLIVQVFSEMEKLDEMQKSILFLKYKENFSLKEISKILEIPVGTIKSRLHYARQELSKRVEKRKIIE